jgi:hypothetical protein
LLKTNFAERNGINLPIYGVPKSNLSEFTTTEKDKNRGTSKFPPPQFRLKDEDIIREAPTQMLKAEVIDQDAFVCVMDDYQGNLELREKQFAENQAQKEYDDEEEDEEYQIPEPGKEPNTRAVNYSKYILI